MFILNMNRVNFIQILSAPNTLAYKASRLALAEAMTVDENLVSFLLAFLLVFFSFTVVDGIIGVCVSDRMCV